MASYFSDSSDMLRSSPPLLLPAPQRIDAFNPAITSSSTMPIEHIAPHHPDLPASSQGYCLNITPHKHHASHPITIFAKTSVGLTHARRTLHQLRVQYGDALPSLRIIDWPALQNRGVMLDISRTRVPTMQNLLSRTRLLASLKINHLQLYTEHTFAYRNWQSVWQGASPITHQQIRTLDQLCCQLNIELVANQNCFGHMSRWLTNPALAPLAETHNTFDFLGITRQGPMSLCPTDPHSIPFVCALLDELLPCFSSNRINLGCDETLDVGQGRSAHALQSQSPLSIWSTFVQQLVDHVVDSEHTPMAWADMPLSHIDQLHHAPKPVEWMVWNYEANAPFDNWCKTLHNAGLPFWVCPGTSAWRSIIGRTSVRQANLNCAVSAAVTHNAQGLLMTNWGDCGHLQQQPIEDHALAHTAALSWNPDQAVDPSAISLHVFNDPSLKISTWLDKLGDADAELRSTGRFDPASSNQLPLNNAGAIFEDACPSGAAGQLQPDPQPWRDCYQQLSALADSMPATPNPVLTDQLTHTLNLAKLLALKAARKRSLHFASHNKTIRDLSRRIPHDHRRLWLMTSRFGSLPESAAILARMIHDEN